MHMPHMHVPQFRFHRGSSASVTTPAHAKEHHHLHPIEKLKRLEGAFDLFTIALVVALALAMAYGLLTATGHPTYFDRWPS